MATVTEILPLDALTACVAHGFWGMVARVLKDSRLGYGNEQVLRYHVCFVPNVISPTNSAAKRAATTGGTTAGIGPVPDFRHEFLCNGITAAKLQVCSDYPVLTVLLTLTVSPRVQPHDTFHNPSGIESLRQGVQRVEATRSYQLVQPAVASVTRRMNHLRLLGVRRVGSASHP